MRTQDRQPVGLDAEAVDIDVDELVLHRLRVTVASNALDQEADVLKVQAWLAVPTSPQLYYEQQSWPKTYQLTGEMLKLSLSQR